MFPVVVFNIQIDTSPDEPDQLAYLCVSHVCHQWCEIALNQPLLWSHVALTSAGVAEMLAQAKTVPLHLEASVPIDSWDGSRFSVFQNELQTHVSHICHLGITAEYRHLRKTLEGLVSPAPTFHYPAQNTSTEQYSREYSSPTIFSMAPPLGSLASCSGTATLVGSHRS